MGGCSEFARPTQKQVLFLTWLAYVFFNVARKTTSVVKSRLQDELGLTPYELGAMDTGLAAPCPCPELHAMDTCRAAPCP